MGMILVPIKLYTFVPQNLRHAEPQRPPPTVQLQRGNAGVSRKMQAHTIGLGPHHEEALHQSINLNRRPLSTIREFLD